MIKINWIITDDISLVGLKEFNSEWNQIYGYFELCINNHSIGYCPNRQLFKEEEGVEDILYWLSKLTEGIICIYNNQAYEIQLLSMNLAKVILKKNDKLAISFANSNTNKVIWCEEIDIQEFYNEILNNIHKFILEIQKYNATLLEANLIKNILKSKEILEKIK